jgi:hypothetical protein
MPTIMADHDVEGHLQLLIRIWSSGEWNEIWIALSCQIETFQRMGISTTSLDVDIWRLCQERQIVLITGNRNAESEDSLEATIRREGNVNSLPVLTISDPDRMYRDRQYATDVAERAIDYLQTINDLRGTGRLFVP